MMLKNKFLLVLLIIPLFLIAQSPKIKVLKIKGVILVPCYKMEKDSLFFVSRENILIKKKKEFPLYYHAEGLKKIVDYNIINSNCNISEELLSKLNNGNMIHKEELSNIFQYFDYSFAFLKIPDSVRKKISYDYRSISGYRSSDSFYGSSLLLEKENLYRSQKTDSILYAAYKVKGKFYEFKDASYDSIFEMYNSLESFDIYPRAYKNSKTFYVPYNVTFKPILKRKARINKKRKLIKSKVKKLYQYVWE